MQPYSTIALDTYQKRVELVNEADYITLLLFDILQERLESIFEFTSDPSTGEQHRQV